MISSRVQEFSIVAGTNLILPSDRQRVGVIISPTVILTTSQGFRVDVNGADAFLISASSPRLVLTLADHGSLVQARMQIVDLFGGTVGAFTIMTLPEEYLSAGLEEFQSKYGLKR